MTVSVNHSAFQGHRLSLASVYLLLALLTSCWLLQSHASFISFAVITVDVEQRSNGVENDLDSSSDLLSGTIAAYFSRPDERQLSGKDSARPRYVFSLRLIRGPPLLLFG
ncbi:MAG: hypothetical protein V7629_08225 [Motiliproteus sp.]